MGYCRKHRIGWRDDNVRDEQFACPRCEQEGSPVEDRIDEWCDLFANPEEERQFLEELRGCGLTDAQVGRLLRVLDKRFPVVT